MRAPGHAWLSLLVAGLVLAGCAGPPQQQSHRSSGDEYPVQVSSCDHASTLRAKPRRAVTLNQGATEMALALGVSGQLAGTAYLDNEIPQKWKAAYDKVPVLAKKYPGKEKLLAKKPDFAYATFESAYGKDGVGSQAGLDRTGVPSYLSPLGCTGDDARATVRWRTIWSEINAMGKAFGVPSRARSLVAGGKRHVEKARESNNGKQRTAFWYDSGDKTPFAGAGDGGPQLIMNAVGLKNVFSGQSGGWADVNWEKVVSENPDVIVLADAGFSSAKRKLTRLRRDPALRSLKAVRNGNIVVVPFDQTNPGVTLSEGAATVSDGLGSLDR